MDKYKIAISEDNEKALIYIRHHLAQEFKKRRIQLSIDSFTDNSALLQSVRAGNQYDIFFLDIEMPGLNGIEVSRKLRETGNDNLLVFI